MQLRKKTAHNKPIAYMAADVNTQASVLRRNISYYPQCSLLETATNASAKPLPAIAPRLRVMVIVISDTELAN